MTMASPKRVSERGNPVTPDFSMFSGQLVSGFSENTFGHGMTHVGVWDLTLGSYRCDFFWLGYPMLGWCFE